MNQNTIITTKRVMTIATKTPTNQLRYNTIYNNDYCNDDASNYYNNGIVCNDYVNDKAKNNYNNGNASNDYDNGDASNDYNNGNASNDYNNGDASIDYNNLCSEKAQLQFTRFKLKIMATMEIFQLQQTIMAKQKQLRMVVERFAEVPRAS